MYGHMSTVEFLIYISIPNFICREKLEGKNMLK